MNRCVWKAVLEKWLRVLAEVNPAPNRVTWANHRVVLWLTFLIYKIGMITLTS